jgi:hypothetical protein
MKNMRLRQGPGGEIEATSGSPFKVGFYPTEKALMEVNPEEVTAMALGIAWFMSKNAGYTRQEFMSHVLHNARQVIDTFDEKGDGI